MDLLSFVVLAQLVSSHGVPAPEPAASAGGLSWKTPASFTVAPNTSSMRLATYHIAPAPGDKEGGEVALFYFGKGQGGSVESNVSRWISQFEPEKGAAVPHKPPKKMDVKGIPVTMVSAEGSYSAGMPGGPSTFKLGWALYGAIAEGPDGPVFFKMVGPKKTVAKAAPDLDALVKSLAKSR